MSSLPPSPADDPPPPSTPEPLAASPSRAKPPAPPVSATPPGPAAIEAPPPPEVPPLLDAPPLLAVPPLLDAPSQLDIPPLLAAPPQLDAPLRSATPPELSPPPPTPPPSPALFPAPPSPVLPLPARHGLSGPLRIALVVVGALQLLLALLVPPANADLHGISYRIGTVIGGTAIWPLIVIGLFSIGRSFRTPRSRAIITLSVWSLVIVGHLGNIGRSRDRPPTLRIPDWSLAPAGPTTPAPLADLPEFNSTLTGSPRATKSTPPPPPTTTPLTTVADVPAYDFSAGSDERLVKQISHAGEERYHAVVAAYARTCAARPDDVRLALERVKFIEHFAEAEDVNIESAAADRDAAAADLKRRFPTAPETILYLLERAYGPEFERQADESARLVPRWPAAARARFFLLRANAANTDSRAARAQYFARLSFEADPSAEAGLILARAAREANDRAEGLRLLSHRVFDNLPLWQKKQKMDLLFDWQQADQAVALYQEIQAASPLMLNQPETAMRLARAGQVAAARAIFARLLTNDWNRAIVNRSRFAFELEFGDAAHARDAYRELRATGIRADPFLRDRFELFRKYPRLGWNPDDLAGAFVLALLVAMVVVMPLLVLVPAHYWSLLRARSGKIGAWPEARWGLRAAWAAFGFMFFAELGAIWVLRPALMRSWWDHTVVREKVADQTLLAEQFTVWLALAAVLGLLVWRARAWPLLGFGRWSVGKSIGLAVAVTLLLRVALVAYALVWPGAVNGDFATLSPETRQLCFALQKTFGPLGLVAALSVLVPLLEELLFRGVLLQALAKHLPFGWANAGQALAFAAVHENLRLLPFFFAFGAVGGIMVRRSGGLLPSMLMHAGNNFLACLVLVAMNRGAIPSV